jgi:gamma-glutamyl-gamma-aminobutyrate hydrolase PuuD
MLGQHSDVSEQQAVAMGVRVYEDPRESLERLRPRPANERQQRANAISKRLEAGRQIPRAPLTIAHRDEGRGTGAFWDHFTFQRMTGRPTIASVADDMRAEFATHYMSGEKSKGHNYRGELPSQPFAMPHEQGSGHGLLVITGSNYGLESEQPRRHPDHTPSSSAAQRNHIREQHERTLLQEARLSGRPVFAVCGGSWRVLEAFGGQTRQLNSKTHQSRQMPYLKKDGSVGGGKNIREHGVEFSDSSMLAGAMRGSHGTLPTNVNSVHWAAADERRPGELTRVERLGAVDHRVGPQMLSVAARGVTDSHRPYVGVRGPELAQRAPHSVEAFETVHGAPVVAVQWHPEAYNSSHPDHAANRRLMNYMAQAGDAFEARRSMTREFSFVAGALRAQNHSVKPNNVRNASKQLSRFGK